MLGGLIRSLDRPSRQVSKRDKMGTAAWGERGGDLPTKSVEIKSRNMLLIIRNCYEQLIVLLK